MMLFMPCNLPDLVEEIIFCFKVCRHRSRLLTIFCCGLRESNCNFESPMCCHIIYFPTVKCFYCYRMLNKGINQKINQVYHVINILYTFHLYDNVNYYLLQYSFFTSDLILQESDHLVQKTLEPVQCQYYKTVYQFYFFFLNYLKKHDFEVEKSQTEISLNILNLQSNGLYKLVSMV